jgi:hypothetical protein
MSLPSNLTERYCRSLRNFHAGSGFDVERGIDAQTNIDNIKGVSRDFHHDRPLRNMKGFKLVKRKSPYYRDEKCDFERHGWSYVKTSKWRPNDTPDLEMIEKYLYLREELQSDTGVLGGIVHTTNKSLMLERTDEFQEAVFGDDHPLGAFAIFGSEFCDRLVEPLHQQTR